MRQNSFGRLSPFSRLTLGGGGIGMVWGGTTFEESVATAHAAVAAGINLIDLAPRYGDGTAERVVGEAPPIVATLAAVRIDLLGTTADFRRFGPTRSLPLN